MRSDLARFQVLDIEVDGRLAPGLWRSPSGPGWAV